MPIDNASLKALYQARPGGAGLSSRKGCPPPERLLGVLRSELSSRRATKVIDHLSRCGACSGEFGFLAEAPRSEAALLRDLEPGLPGRRPEASAGPDDLSRSRPGTEGRSLFSRLSWRVVPVGAVLALALVLVSTRLSFRSRETYRADGAARVELLRPAGDVHRQSLMFRWTLIPGRDRYVLRLFDQELAPVWQSGRLVEGSFRLPPEAAGKLESGRPYFWMITAGGADGLEIKSTLTEFSVRD